MKSFSTRLSIFAGLTAGGLSFIVTPADSFFGICDFHGTLAEFAGYFLNGLSGCIMNGIMACCMAGIIAYPFAKYIEIRGSKS